MADAPIAAASPAAPAPALEIDTELAEQNTEETEEQATETPEAEAKAKEAEAKAKEAINASKRKLQAKVNGKTMDVEIDTNDDKELLKYVQKALAADEKFTEAATTKKQMQQLMQMLQEDPIALLSNPALGINIKDLAQKVLIQELEEAEKSPEQRELEQLKKELAQEKKYKEEMEKQRQESQMEALKNEAFQALDQEISEAIEASDLPKSPYVVKRITDTLIEAVNLGYTDVTVKDIMPLIEEQMSNELQKMFEMMPEDRMEKLIGSNNLGRMRKSRLAKAKAAQKIVDPNKSIKDTGASVEAKAEAKANNENKEDKKSFKQLFGSF